MFGKILSDTYAKVLTKTDEIGTSVRQQATRAVCEVLGLPSVPLSAKDLESNLEYEAGHTTRLPNIWDMHVRWIEKVRESSSSAEVYITNGSAEEHKSAGGGSVGSSGKDGLKEESPESPSASSRESVGHNDEGDDEGFKSPTSATTPPSLILASSTEMGSALSMAVEAPAVGRPDDLVMPPGSFLTFKQVLLRSKAIEISLATIARLEDVRTVLAGPLEEGEIGTPRAAVHQLLSLCMRVDTKLLTELLFLFCSTDGSSDDAHMAYLTKLVSILKLDWRDDFLFESRRHLATDIERLKFEISHTANMSATPLTADLDCSQGKDSAEDRRESDGSASAVDQMSMLAGSDKHEMRVKASRKLIELYKSTKRNLEKCTKLRQEHRVSTATSLRSIMGLLDSSEKEYETARHGAAGRSTQIQEEMVMNEEEILKKLLKLEKERELVDGDIAALEDEKQKLLLTVDKLSKQLSELEAVQEGSLESTSKVTTELNRMRRRYRSKIATEDDLKHHSLVCRQDLQNICTVVMQAEKQIDPVLRALTEDVESKSIKIVRPVSELIGKHLAYEKGRLLHQTELLQFFIHSLERLAAEISRSHSGEISQHQLDSKQSEEQHEPLDINTATTTATSTQSTSAKARHDAVMQAHSGRKRYLTARLMDLRHKFSRCIAQFEECWYDIQAFAKHEQICPPEKQDQASPVRGALSVTAGADGNPTGEVKKDVPDRLTDYEIAFRELQKIYMDIKMNTIQPNLHLLHSGTKLSAIHSGEATDVAAATPHKITQSLPEDVEPIRRRSSTDKKSVDLTHEDHPNTTEIDSTEKPTHNLSIVKSTPTDDTIPEVIASEGNKNVDASVIVPH